MNLTPIAGAEDDAAKSADPFLWLEDVEGDKALDWVRERNKKSTDLIQSDSTYKELESDLLEILASILKSKRGPREDK